MIDDSKIAKESRAYENSSTVNRTADITSTLRNSLCWWDSSIKGLRRTAAAEQFSAAWRAAFSQRVRQCTQMRERSRQNREQRIRERAYFLSQQSGFPTGRDLEFWVQASAQSQSHDSAYPRGDTPESGIAPVRGEPSV
jgi:hypothetical protein